MSLLFCFCFGLSCHLSRGLDLFFIDGLFVVAVVVDFVVVVVVVVFWGGGAVAVATEIFCSCYTQLGCVGIGVK